MNLKDLTNLQAIKASLSRINIGEIFSYENIRQYFGLYINKAGYYGTYDPTTKETTALEINQTEFTSTGTVNILIEGYINLPKLPTVSGGGTIAYSGYGILEVNGTKVFDGRSGGGGTANAIPLAGTDVGSPVTGPVAFNGGKITNNSGTAEISPTADGLISKNTNAAFGFGLRNFNATILNWLQPGGVDGIVNQLPDLAGKLALQLEVQDSIFQIYNRTWGPITWVAATPRTLSGATGDYKSFNGVNGDQTVNYTLGAGQEIKFVINKISAVNVASNIIIPSASVILLDIAPSEASFAANVVTLTGPTGSKYLFEAREINGDYVTLITKIASDGVINSPKVFYCNNTIYTVGSGTLNADVTQFTIPYLANSWGANTTVRFMPLCKGGSGTNSKTFKLYDQTLGATNGLIYSFNNAAASQSLQREYVMYCHTANSQTIVTAGASATEVTRTLDLTVNRTFIASININNVTEADSLYKGLLIVQHN